MAISVMLKPSSSSCNLKCDYCFYNSVADSRQQSFKGMMTIDTAKNVIISAYNFAEKDQVSFVFQGGEPLLIGIDFYKEFIKIANEKNINNCPLSICVQTNGTLLNDEWCEFFKENNILVGVSLDGDEQLNSYRKYPDGTNAFNDIMSGINLLKKQDVSFNILSVLTKRMANNVRQSYRFFKANDLHYLQYIPCLKPFDCEQNEFAMENDDYEYYLNKGLKIYYNDIKRGNKMSIRQFNNYVLLLKGEYAEQCGMNGPCSNQFVVEGDGSVYPCDFYCTDEWYLGNINQLSFEDMYNSPKTVEFLKDSFKMKDECKTCEYFNLCRAGGCKRNRENYDYCNAYKSFFANCTNMLEELKG